MRSFVGYWKKKYIKAMRHYKRLPKEKAEEQYNILLGLFRGETQFIQYLVMEIEDARKDFEWRRHNVIWSEWREN